MEMACVFGSSLGLTALRELTVLCASRGTSVQTVAFPVGHPFSVFPSFTVLKKSGNDSEEHLKRSLEAEEKMRNTLQIPR